MGLVPRTWPPSVLKYSEFLVMCTFFQWGKQMTSAFLFIVMMDHTLNTIKYHINPLVPKGSPLDE